MGVSPETHRMRHEVRVVRTMERYRDGYIHARAVNGFGAAVKVVALIIGAILVFAGLQAFNSTTPGFGSGIGEIGGVVIIVAGFLLGGLGYILGVLVQSAGQSMKAHFDCAVNGSHFLNDDQRAEVMSLK